MKDVADRAGVGVGTLYRHFENRQRLVSAVLEFTRAEILASVEMAVTGCDVEQAFRGMLRVSAEATHRYGALRQVALAEHLEMDIEVGRTPFRAIWQDLLARALREGFFRSDVDMAVVGAAFQAIFSSGKLSELADTRGAAAAADAFADLFLRGCRAES